MPDPDHSLPAQPESRFAIGETDFLLDGEPVRLLSGALHYFRVHPDQWADRIEKARLLGLNAIETYVAWNAHSPEPGVFDTEGGLDLDRFLREIAAAGMHAIVRPGPYICAEWDGGGLPPWLFGEDGVGVRRHELRYLEAVSAYLDDVLTIVAPHQVDRGGPVVLLQVENEYGAYGGDAEYLAELVRVFRRNKITVPLTTVDQPRPEWLDRGSLPGLHKTASFGSRSPERLATLRRHQPTGPLMCMEYWNGWFDRWGDHHHTTDAAEAAADLDALLSTGASVNLYMFHGGTNYGTSGGANDEGRYAAMTTSYDYDAPLDESGHPSAKYHAFREVIARHAPVPDEVPGPRPAAPEVRGELGGATHLLAGPEAWGEWQHHDALPTLDALGSQVKLALLTTELTGPEGPCVLDLGEVRDRAAVWLDGAPVGVLLRDLHESSLLLPRGSGTLTVLVEDHGRVNYGARIGEAKGLIGEVSLGGSPVRGWRVMPLEHATLPERVPATEGAGVHDGAGPALVRGTLELDEPADLFLDTAGWGKGLVWVNGFCLGRYWRRGPQRTLYVPGPVTRAGANEVAVLELEVMADPTLRTLAGPELGPLSD